MTHPKPLTENDKNWSRAHLTVSILLLLMGAFIVFNTWSPSSYGVALRSIGADSSGLIKGPPRGIRSDEWAVVTPLTQATVNNNFERYNHTSLYQEDLRINYGLPIHDWGIIFKPSMWLYGWVNPAYAYAFHWFVIAALFIVGYAWLLRWFGATPVLAFSLALGLYFTGMVQFWWNEKGPIFALFPWVLLPFATRWPIWLKATAFYWLAVVWLLTNFYPPMQVSLAFVGAVLLLARAPELLRPARVALLTLAALLAAATAVIYLGDYLRETASTLYPGARRSSGGLDLLLIASWIFPALNFDRGFGVTFANICEVGTVGMYYTLLVLVFLDYRNWRVLLSDRWSTLVLGGGALLMLAWIVLPLPWWAGAPLLWHYVPPSRMQFASGVLLLFLIFHLVNRMGLRLNGGRVCALVIAVLTGLILTQTYSKPFDWQGLVALPLLLGALIYAQKHPMRAHATFAVSSLLLGFLLFARFNAIQSAWPIFNPPQTAITRAMDAMQASNQGILVVEGFSGATANGLGYRSLGHVTAVPKLAFWQEHFPHLPQAELNSVFNRYAHIKPTHEVTPRVLQPDAISIPAADFIYEPNVRYINEPYATADKGGNIDSAELDGTSLVLSGWAPWTEGMETHDLEIFVDPEPAGAAKRLVVLRPDVANALLRDELMSSGFKLRIPFHENLLQKPAVCIYFHETPGGAALRLQNPPDLPDCQPNEIVSP